MEGFGWRTERYEFVDDVPAVDLLTGDERVREGIDAGASVEELMRVGSERMAEWRAGERGRWMYG